MENEIKTTGQMRKFLLSSMVDTRTSRLELDKANVIYKIAGQVNASIYGEIKANMLLEKMGKETEKLGNMDITGGA